MSLGFNISFWFTGFISGFSFSVCNRNRFSSSLIFNLDHFNINSSSLFFSRAVSLQDYSRNYWFWFSQMDLRNMTNRFKRYLRKLVFKQLIIICNLLISKFETCFVSRYTRLKMNGEKSPNQPVCASGNALQCKVCTRLLYRARSI